jgi:hypothetical protein
MLLVNGSIITINAMTAGASAPKDQRNCSTARLTLGSSSA